MNLTTTYPRSVKEKLAGYVHLGRMLDKCRSLLAKTQGEYVYPCPMDQRLLELSGMTADQFLHPVEERPNDEAVVEWFLKTATPHGEADIDAWNAMMLSLVRTPRINGRILRRYAMRWPRIARTS